MSTWKLDNAHTQVTFSAKHMMVTTVRGQFHDMQGTIELDETDPTRSRGAFTVATASVDTNFGARDTHLRSADFFDVEKNPALTFTSRSITRKGTSAFDLTGDLTIHGVTRPVTFDVSFLGKAKDPWGNERIAFEADVTINRKDYGLNWNAALETGGFLVGDEVKVSLSVQAVPKPA
jgi:polyisoprenoid-binding protein YceI